MQKRLTGFPEDECYMGFRDGNCILERLVKRLVVNGNAMAGVQAQHQNRAMSQKKKSCDTYECIAAYSLQLPDCELAEILCILELS